MDSNPLKKKKHYKSSINFIVWFTKKDLGARFIIQHTGLFAAEWKEESFLCLSFF